LLHGARTIKNGYKLLFTVLSPSHQLPIENREIASPLSQLYPSSRFGASFLKPHLTSCFTVDLFAQASKKTLGIKSPGFTSHKMEAIQTHPSNAAQAKAFTAPGSLSFPGGANEFANPAAQANGMATNGVQQQGVQATNGTGVTPATPAATPGAGPAGPSGITPTLQ
jgi:hypothetical protein